MTTKSARCRPAQVFTKIVRYFNAAQKSIARHFLIKEGETFRVRVILLLKACDTLTVSYDIYPKEERYWKVSRGISLRGVWYSSSIIRHFSRRHAILYSIVRHRLYGRAIHFYVAQCWHNVTHRNTITLKETQEGKNTEKNLHTGEYWIHIESRNAHSNCKNNMKEEHLSI